LHILSAAFNNKRGNVFIQIRNKASEISLSRKQVSDRQQQTNKNERTVR